MAKSTKPLESTDATDTTIEAVAVDQIRVLDVTPSPEDSRDWSAEGLLAVAKYPPTLDLRQYCQPVRDQGPQGACAAMAGSAMKEAQESKDYQLREYLSPQYIYNMRENKTSSGMYMRNLMKILNTNGVCTETTYPYNSTATITKAMHTEAAKFRIKGYASISSIDGLKTALYTNGPAVIAMPVYNTEREEIWNQLPSDKMLGGHAMCVVGYDANGFIIRNSWGNGWGNAGYTVFPYSHWGKQWEVWTTIDIITGPNKTTGKTSNSVVSIIGRAIKRFFRVRGSFVVNSSECRKVPRAKRD